MKANVYEITVGPADTDAYNIVHHPMYFIWAEAAIYRHMAENMADTLSQRDFTIAAIHCKFNRPARLHDQLSIFTKPRTRPLDNGNLQFEVKIVNTRQRYPVLTGVMEIRPMGTMTAEL